MADVEKELALRLAWYIDRYGVLDDRDLVRLALIANGFARDDEAKRIRALVVEILSYVKGP